MVFSIPLMIARFVSSGFGSGYAPKAPGTFGSAAAFLLWWMVHQCGVVGSLASQGALVVLTAIVGTVMVSLSLRSEVVGDPQWIVIDEWVGVFIALFGLAPERWGLILIGFVSFRIFDASKIALVGLAERLPGAYGIMADDIVAGVFARLVVYGCATVCAL